MPNPPPPSSTSEIAEDLVLLDTKLKQAKFEYEQYFMGSRPREPILTRAEVQKIVVRYSNMGIPNTALRFKFNNLCARFFAMRRQWDETLRKIEAGTYERHVFKAKLRDRSQSAPPPANGRGTGTRSPDTTAGGSDLFEAYLNARQSCGEDVNGVSREKLDGLVASQRDAIRKRTGCDDVKFRVVVENGKTKLKATPVKSASGS